MVTAVAGVAEQVVAHDYASKSYIRVNGNNLTSGLEGHLVMSPMFRCRSSVSGWPRTP
jgi:hypothetical protein